MHIQNCHLSGINGILAPKLKSLTIRNCPSPKVLQIMNLQSVDELIISNSGLSYLSSRDYIPFDINKRASIKDSKSSGITLKVKSIFGTFTLKDNSLLEELDLSDLEALGSPIKNIGNPSLKKVKISRAMLGSHQHTVSQQGFIYPSNISETQLISF
ncbi:hypothetical protein DSO57_1039334 [Entomophthora muscae]|uniref:Uncharacterized protein n=2 Tax=Entomophthora muscae TaxID=34485 RepID=A0ACC2SZ82_9FUNG|nr:hypothetical protein DSO57_1039334 [Entomophthora muscae]